MKRFALPVIALLMSPVLATATQAASIVQNGGFETGSLTGWTSGFGNFVDSASDYVHSGRYGVAFGAVGFNSNLSQILNTTAGTQYQISFWLDSNNRFPNAVTLDFGGQRIFDRSNFTTTGFQEFTLTAFATSALTTLAFGLRQDPGYSGLDDISVAAISPVPLPASAPLFGGAILVLASLGYAAKRRGGSESASASLA